MKKIFFGCLMLIATFRFNSGIFINTGVNIGFEIGSKKTLEYSNNKGKTVDVFSPHISLDLGIGYEFDRK